MAKRSETTSNDSAGMLCSCRIGTKGALVASMSHRSMKLWTLLRHWSKGDRQCRYKIKLPETWQSKGNRKSGRIEVTKASQETLSHLDHEIDSAQIPEAERVNSFHRVLPSVKMFDEAWTRHLYAGTSQKPSIDAWSWIWRMVRLLCLQAYLEAYW